MQITKHRLLGQLRAAGVARVQVEYSGYGDEGIVDPPTLYDHAGRGLDLGGVYGDVTERVCEFVEDQLQQHSPGWEINEGGGGSVAIDVPDQTVHFDHGLYSEPVLVSQPFEV